MLLSACGGGTTTITGSAGDGPITGGTLSVTDGNGKAVTTGKSGAGLTPISLTARLHPILKAKPGYTSKLFQIIANQGYIQTKRMGGNEQVITTNDLA